MVEKPAPADAPSDLAIIGRYVLTPDLFPILAETPPDSRGEVQLTNGLRTLRQRRPIYAVEFEGTPLRHRRQARLPQGHRGLRPGAARSRRTISGPTSRAWACRDEEVLR